MERQPRGPERDGQDRRFYTPDASSGRQAVERRSASLLLWLQRAPRWLVALLPAALLLVGLAAPSVVGGIVLLVLTGVLGWLAYLSWPSLGKPGQILRLAALLVLLVLATLRLLGQF